jgi:hypothetical protein
MKTGGCLKILRSRCSIQSCRRRWLLKSAATNYGWYSSIARQIRKGFPLQMVQELSHEAHKEHKDCKNL